MDRMTATYGVAVLVVSVALLTCAPAAGAQTPPAARAAASAPIDYNTARLDRRLEAARATGSIMLDGTLD